MLNANHCVEGTTTLFVEAEQDLCSDMMSDASANMYFGVQVMYAVVRASFSTAN